ncbi:oxidoreductase [Polymorphobacter multimanifer]|uniref:Short-subunit dehydrogenase n=1 Tax=Polymorphobacter multimanifer TaxID=1070431 RepID=A0A841L4S9_9SPHN|nr:SDR family NAD(P)-dependent oxidoreductase [Polymorphobacter multimanifer]MBB6227647.1 short-subunit dehydrogenase [Polymorphobacter multimanifer]GGI75162.1 oxidoreductase [Polymorphobacter multimanifer]
MTVRKKRFAGQHVWITGASSGIGRALALGFAAEGAKLLLSGRNEAALAETAAACGGAEVLAFEATAMEALPGVVDAALARMGHIDILSNNAGISQRSLALDTEFSVYRELMEVDFFAPMRLSHLLLPHMVARKRGALINNASIAGKFGSPLRTGYCAAKHALIGWSDALRAEIAQYGVAVHVVTAGYVATGVARNALTGSGVPVGEGDDPVNDGLPADAAAKIIIDGVAKGQREIPVGKAGAAEMAMLDLKRANPEQLFDFMVGLAPKVAR